MEPVQDDDICMNASRRFSRVVADAFDNREVATIHDYDVLGYASRSLTHVSADAIDDREKANVLATRKRDVT